MDVMRARRLSLLNAPPVYWRLANFLASSLKVPANLSYIKVYLGHYYRGY